MWISISIVLLILCIIILDPMGDAIRDSGNKAKQKSIEILRDFLFYVIFFLLTLNFKFVLLLGLSHLFLRISLHNLIYNWSHTPKFPWWNIGTTCESDEIESGMTKVERLIARLVSFAFAVVLVVYAIKMF